MSKVVDISIVDGIAEVRLERPDKYNAINLAMFDELATAGRELAENTGIRAVILTGAGGNFCSGIDLAALQGLLSSNEAFREAAKPLEGEVANRFQQAAHVWRGLEVPVLAAIEGICFGGGLQIALGADIRIATPTARLSIMEVRWGIVPDMGLMAVLPRLMPIDRAKELVWSGRIVEGEEALAIGLVTETSAAPLSRARDLAKEFAARSPDAIVGAKRLLDHGWSMGTADALSLEAAVQSEIIGLTNQKEAVAANLEQRKPRFSHAGRRSIPE